MTDKTKETIWFEKSNEDLPEGIYPGMMQTKIYNAMQAYADQEKRKDATNFLVFCRRMAKELKSDPWEWGKFDRLCSDQKYTHYLQSIT